ncbi:MAG: 1-acyl-sn-glycerol-3-phosphate acyltransferase [Pseudomonadota bacterium]
MLADRVGREQARSDEARRDFESDRITYASPFRSPLKRGLIHAIEKLSGRSEVLEIFRRSLDCRAGDASVWDAILKTMRVELLTPAMELARIPAKGPAIMVANHPQGIMDGFALGAVISRRRPDFRILTRAHFCVVPHLDPFLLPVPFPHEPDFIAKNLESRRATLSHLKQGGCIGVFPAGTVAASETLFGSTVEPEWGPFTARLAARTSATIVPMFLPREASRAFHIAHQLSMTMRQCLFLHEIAYAIGKPQDPIIGEALRAEDFRDMGGDADARMAALRLRTLNLADSRPTVI